MLLFVLYLILMVGGMVILGLSFASPVLPALVFVLGLLCIVAAVAIPVTAGAFEQRR
ncbi:hypothetical protein ACLBXX_10195 [Microbacterium sp. C23T]|uniref:hypothetical protein n=1 Tax=Microbacterium sp. Leaf288 TaxID=1736323 RepID=UPI000AC7578D|nr:hypothetical protein [Microbacterium sp. Leaf288]